MDALSGEQSETPSQFVQYFYRKTPTLVRATAFAAVTLALSDAPSAAACRHFSIWHFPFPQSCPPKQIGQFIEEPSPPIPAPASPLTPDEDAQRQHALVFRPGEGGGAKFLVAFSKDEGAFGFGLGEELMHSACVVRSRGGSAPA